MATRGGAAPHLPTVRVHHLRARREAQGATPQRGSPSAAPRCRRAPGTRRGRRPRQRRRAVRDGAGSGASTARKRRSWTGTPPPDRASSSCRVSTATAPSASRCPSTECRTAGGAGRACVPRRRPRRPGCTTPSSGVRPARPRGALRGAVGAPRGPVRAGRCTRSRHSSQVPDGVVAFQEAMAWWKGKPAGVTGLVAGPTRNAHRCRSRPR